MNQNPFLSRDKDTYHCQLAFLVLVYSGDAAACPQENCALLAILHGVSDTGKWNAIFLYSKFKMIEEMENVRIN